MSEKVTYFEGEYIHYTCVKSHVLLFMPEEGRSFTTSFRENGTFPSATALEPKKTQRYNGRLLPLTAVGFVPYLS